MGSGKKKSPTVLAHDKARSSVFGTSDNGDVGFSITDDCITVLGRLQDEVESKFTPKKESSELLAGVYREIFLREDNPEFFRRYSRVACCGSYLEFHVTGETKKLHVASFCKDRLCSMCNWRRSLKIFGQVSRVMDCLEKDGYQFLFLTLTVKNCSADDLPKTVQVLFDGWRKLYNKKSVFQRLVAGTFRSLEVTRNQRTGFFHPHLHVILAVRPDYFSGRNYMTQAAWSRLWRDCCDLDYNPIVDIRRVKPKFKKNGELIDGIAGVVAEVAKYSVKSADFLNGSMDDQISYVRAFLAALSGRRLCSFTGCFMRVRKQLSMDDVEDGDLLNVDGDNLRDDVAYMVVRYSWKAGFYAQEIVSFGNK